MTQPDWQDPALATWYNRTLGFSEQQVARYIERLKLTPRDTLVDFGCGNGTLLLAAAKLVKSALGVELSDTQLAEAREKTAGFANVSFLQTSFETCSLDGLRFTRGSARKSLHHLTDEGKTEFFKRVGPAFESGALFVIEDAVLDFELSALAANMTRLEEEAAAYYGPLWPHIREQFMLTMNTEYPTSENQWIAAARAGGFAAENCTRKTCFYGVITLRKP